MSKKEKASVDRNSVTFAPGMTEREKAMELALTQIERRFGKGAIMKLGDAAKVNVEVIPTGSIALDLALGIGGVPRGRITEIYGPELLVKQRSACMSSPMLSGRVDMRPSSMQNMHLIPLMPLSVGLIPLIYLFPSQTLASKHLKLSICLCVVMLLMSS